MAFDDPHSIDLASLFRDPTILESRRAWEVAGFRIVNRAGKILVAQHPSVRGLLFKRYTEVDENEQLRNFERRVAGARRLRTFVSSHGLSRLAVPQKWIFSLPRHRKAHVLVVEHLALCSQDVAARYQRIDPATLRDLCVTLYHFRGMDSNVKNLPFMQDDRIGLVDTEHWDRNNRKAYLRQVEPYLSRDCRKLAAKLFDRLEGNEDLGNLSSRNDFDDEDTSSSTSSSS